MANLVLHFLEDPMELDAHIVKGSLQCERAFKILSVIFRWNGRYSIGIFCHRASAHCWGCGMHQEKQKHLPRPLDQRRILWNSRKQTWQRPACSSVVWFNNVSVCIQISRVITALDCTHVPIREALWEHGSVLMNRKSSTEAKCCSLSPYHKSRPFYL